MSVADQELAIGFLPALQIHPLSRSSIIRTFEYPALVKSSLCSSTLRSVMPVHGAYFSASFETVVFAPL
jgi:hypothetical protein